jgi:hypothetical protein
VSVFSARFHHTYIKFSTDPQLTSGHVNFTETSKVELILDLRTYINFGPYRLYFLTDLSGLVKQIFTQFNWGHVSFMKIGAVYAIVYTEAYMSFYCYLVSNKYRTIYEYELERMWKDVAVASFIYFPNIFL